jgi:hypothetical protein
MAMQSGLETVPESRDVRAFSWVNPAATSKLITSINDSSSTEKSVINHILQIANVIFTSSSREEAFELVLDCFIINVSLKINTDWLSRQCFHSAKQLTTGSNGILTQMIFICITT